VPHCHLPTALLQALILVIVVVCVVGAFLIVVTFSIIVVIILSTINLFAFMQDKAFLTIFSCYITTIV
jgi:hypothetical protein